MKIGIFDSGLGGLILCKAISSYMPNHSYIYLGDTLNVPYGGRSKEAIIKLTKNALKHLFDVEKCDGVVIACNTACAFAFDDLQNDFMTEYKDKFIYSIVPATIHHIETLNKKRIGIIGTQATISSKIYEKTNTNPDEQFFRKATPLLVPLVENNGEKYALEIISDYLKEFEDKQIDALILGCTHYPYFKHIFKNILDDDVKVFSQDEFTPKYLKDFLQQNYADKINPNEKLVEKFLLTDFTKKYEDLSNTLFGKKLEFKTIKV